MPVDASEGDVTFPHDVETSVTGTRETGAGKVKSVSKERECCSTEHQESSDITFSHSLITSSLGS